MTTRSLAARCGPALVLLAAAMPAHAIPAFARKYGTSCLTCHTVYPKLTPFGEAFRRNGYRFPGVDGDYVKQEVVALGQEANKMTFPESVWPGSLPGSLPVAIGFNGQASVHPDKTSTAPRTNQASGGAATRFALDDLVGEGHLWLGAAVSDTVTTWGEVTIASDGTSVEHAQLLFNDLVGPAHAVNLVVGKGFPTLSPFGPHSSYAADAQIPVLPVTGIYGLSTDPFTLVDNYTGLELGGVLGGRLQYAVGLTSGKNSFAATFNSESWYASAGYKLGGMRLDGEGDTGPKDAMRPWAETSLTLHGFVYHSNEHFPSPAVAGAAENDVSFTAGGGLRAMVGSAELDLGFYSQSHDRGTAALGKVTGTVAYGELSYVVFPWLVPVLRVEQVSLRPSGGTSVSDLHLMPAVAFLVRPNVKLVVAGNIESASGFPGDASGGLLPWQGGSGDSGALGIAPRDPGAPPGTKAQEFSSLTFFLAWAL